MEFSKYAVAGIAASLVIYSYYGRYFENKIRKGSYFEKSLNLLKGYKPVVDIFGEPIKTKRIETNNKFNKLDKKAAKLIIPVYGPNGNGNLYTWSTKLEDDSDWQVQQLDIEIVQPTNRRWTFYKRGGQQSEQTPTASS